MIIDSDDVQSVSTQENGRREVGTIFCIGRNYAAHAEEMRASIPKEPVVFIKPPTSVIASGATVRRPTFSASMHHEVEVVLAIGRTCRDLRPDEALDIISGMAIGLDLTLRDVQSSAKAAGRPWTIAKGFDGSAPVGPLVPYRSEPLSFSLQINGELRQQGSTADMIFSPATLLVYLSSIFTLRAGDLLFTGTPEGVGPVESGDRLVAEIADCDESRLEISVA